MKKFECLLAIVQIQEKTTTLSTAAIGFHGGRNDMKAALISGCLILPGRGGN